jgi:hypothetical protein
MWDKIGQSVAEKRNQIESLSDAELEQFLREPSKHSPAEVRFAREELSRRSSTAASSVSDQSNQASDRTTIVARQPMLMAWIMLLVLNTLIAFAINLIVRSTLITSVIMMVVGFFYFQDGY